MEKHRLPEGTKVNLDAQDYTGLVALATSPAGELFFAGVMSGAIPLLQYAGEGRTVCIGIRAAEDDREIHLTRAVAVEPKRLLAVHQATNYSPRDCLRGLWFELTQLQPDMLSNLSVPAQGITRTFDLAGDDVPDVLS